MKATGATILVLGLAAAALPAAADDVADFYRDRTVTITSAGGPGGGYGVYALLLGQHIGRHIPGAPNVIVTYMPGAGGVKAANHAANVAPRDGTMILAPLSSMATLQVLGKKGVRYDAAKFGWIGGATETTSGFLVKPDAARSLADLKSRKQPTVVGVTGSGAPNQIMAALVSYCTGAKIKVVSGYQGSSGVANAYVKDEVEAIAIPLSSLRLVHPQLLKDSLLVQSGFDRSPFFPNVPLLFDVCSDPAKRKIVEVFQIQEVMGRAYVAMPGTPGARVAALRGAFDATMKDPAFLAAARKRNMVISPKTGIEMQKLVAAHVATGTALVNKAKAVVGMK